MVAVDKAEGLQSRPALGAFASFMPPQPMQRFLWPLLCVSLLMPARRPAAETSPNPPPVLAPPLSARNAAEAEALGHFVWGYLRLAEDDHDYDEAVSHLVAALRHDPNSPLLLSHVLALWLGNAAEQRRQIIAHLLPTAARAPTAEKLNLVVARALRRQRFAAAGVGLLSACWRATGRARPDVLAELLHCYREGGLYDDGRELLRQVQRQDFWRDRFRPEAAAAQFYQAMATNALPQLSSRARDQALGKAREHARRASRASVSRGDREAAMALAQMLVATQSHADAAYLLTTLHDSGDWSRQAESMLAHCFEKLGLHHRALPIWAELSELAPESAYYHYRHGRILRQMERSEGALAALERAVALRAGPGILYELAAVSLDLGRPVEALIYARQMPADLPERYVLECRAHRGQRQFAKAVQALEQAREAANKAGRSDWARAEHFLFLARLHEEAGDAQAAITALEEGLRLEPDNPRLNNNLGFLLADAKTDLRRAQKLIRRALRTHPTSPVYLDSLAWAYHRRGWRRRAVKAIEQAMLRRREPSAIVLEHAGDIYQAQGDDAKAGQFWRQALPLANEQTAARLRRKIGADKVSRPE